MHVANEYIELRATAKQRAPSPGSRDGTVLEARDIPALYGTGTGTATTTASATRHRQALRESTTANALEADLAGKSKLLETRKATDAAHSNRCDQRWAHNRRIRPC